MKPLSSLLLPCAVLLQHVAAQGAYLFTIDRSITTPATAMIDSEMASAIIARRRALTADRYLGITDAMLLEDINIYGGYQTPLFGAEEASPGKNAAPGKLFIRISGVEMKIQDFDHSMPDLWIDTPTKDLLTDFKPVSPGIRKEKDQLCEYEVPPSLNAPNSKGVEVIFTYPAENGRCLRSTEIPNIPIILSLHSFLPTDSKSVKTQINGLIRILKHFSATDNVESTVLLLPPENRLSKPKPKKTHKNTVRSAQKSEEERLDLPSPSAASTSLLAKPSSNSSVNSTHPLPHNIPQCFTSQSSCENVTNSCSSHGNCYKAHSNCFKCKCGTTISHVNEDGTTKTVQWGGNACQKKDISVPFILFASFGVVMTALVVGGIGMLWSMGSQELPSVIGAGVAGPKGPGK